MTTARLPREPGANHLVGRVWSSRDTMLVVAVSLAILFAHRDALAAMVDLWRVSPMYSYGFSVPFISGYLIWSRRELLSPLAPQPSFAGGAAVAVLAVVMALAARAAGIQVLDQLAFLASISASILVLFGWRYLRVGWPALGYLLLMVPIWDGFTEPLHQPFQLRSAEIGAWILQSLGVPAYREGMIIALPNLKIEVARECSGVNYLVAVIALGLPLSYLQLPGNWRRVALLASAVVLAALSNGLRVALIGLLAYFEVGSPLHGPFHMLHGLFVAGIGFVVLFAGLRWLTPLTPAASPASAQVGCVSGRLNPAGGPPRPVLTMWPALVLTSLLVIVGSNVASPAPRAAAYHDGLADFPSQLGEWSWDVGRTPAGRGPAIWPGADVELSRSYRRAGGDAFDLYIAYFSSQIQGREMVTYRATALHARSASLALPGERAVMLVANDPADVAESGKSVFWYTFSSGAETNPYVVQARMLLNGLWNGRGDGAVVVLNMPAGADSTESLGTLMPIVERALAARPVMAPTSVR